MRKIIPAVVCTAMLVGCGLRGESPADRVILLANADDPDSVRIAEHYAAQRGVPQANIVALSMPTAETITWPEFVAKVWQPLQDELVRSRWIDAQPMALLDDVGRKKAVISGHRISYLVVCRGVPLRIMNSEVLTVRRPPPYDRAELRTNSGAVDSELSLLAVNNYPINGFVPNPLFHRKGPAGWEQAQVVKVSRLDGPTAESALALVDQALAAERTGLLGRAYVDLSGFHPEGDRWLENTATQLGALGFDLHVDRVAATIPVTARFDAPVLYFGWYAGDLAGPFTLPGFQFPPGAIAVHIHSFSAATLRSITNGWCGPLIARGVTATVGNVFEPYLDFLHRPNLLLEALARGDTFGDAAYYAEPVLSWQSIAIGDPLYRPFARSYDEQWQGRAGLPAQLAGYAALRRIRRLEMTSDPNVSLAEVEEFQQERPSLSLGLALAKRKSELADDPAGAVRALEGFVPPEKFRPDEWALAMETAQLLHRLRAPVLAVKLYACLLREAALPPDWREACLREGGNAAQAAGESEQALQWARELGRLLPEERK